MIDIFPLELLSFIFEIKLIMKEISKVIQIVQYFGIRTNAVRFVYTPFDFILFYLFVLAFRIRLKDANYLKPLK